jgi:Ras-related protein Rab-32
MCREYLFKVLVVGELSTGKTSFIRRYVHQFFNAHYRATIGVDFALKVIQWNESNLLRIQMWDIAGQERFGQMTRVYYKDAVGALVVFDVSKPQTFEAVVKWKVDIDSKVTCPDGSNIPCVLLANKSDEEKAGSLGEPSFLNQFCADNGFVGWFYTSPKEDLNIEQSAKFLLKHIIRQMKQLEDSTSITDDSLDTNAILTLDDRDQMPKKSKSIAFNCC